MRLRLLISLLAVSALGSAQAHAATFTPPSGDRWNYPFASSAGLEVTASSFGNVGDAMFDDRDAQVLVKFDTTGQIAAGAGAANYTVNSAKLTIKLKPEGAQGSWLYDPTYDAHTTYGAGTDGDAGRPIELYGVGFRNGFTSATFLETTAFAPPGPPAPRVRNAYATDYAAGIARDVSNNVEDAFDTTPFAIGTITGLAAGAAAPGAADVIFQLTLGPDALAYLQAGLNGGSVDLMLSALTQAAFGGPPTYPRFEMKEGLVSAASLELDVTVAVVPEPGTLLLVGAGLAGLAGFRRRAE